ncbi:MFS transporter [Stieleria varia]|uniref:NfeD-like C-terminal domain-containing protein n=1 Tax=Stieleria varia TaxID=2528005 RepID=A0A5C6AT86_9BACT|nr:hypothetical protein [Stieleria varia]TWU02647.1 hypothetical protein Pla52n_37040 [Stieleria varia]
MSIDLMIGDRAMTRGPLKPGGQIRVGELCFAARSQGEWIDSNSEVEIIGGNMEQVLVRPVEPDAVEVAARGRPLPRKGENLSSAPIQAPPSWVETIRADWLGGVGGAIAALMIWFGGQSFSPMAISVPVAGFVCGWLFRKFVGIPAEMAGPYSDHRSVALGLAFVISFVTLLGAVVGQQMEPAFLGVSFGMVLGTVTAGAAIFLLSILAHL